MVLKFFASDVVMSWTTSFNEMGSSSWIIILKGTLAFAYIKQLTPQEVVASYPDGNLPYDWCRIAEEKCGNMIRCLLSLLYLQTQGSYTLLWQYPKLKQCQYAAARILSTYIPQLPCCEYSIDAI